MTDERPEGFNTLVIESKPGDGKVRFFIDASPLESLVSRAERRAGAKHPGDYVWLPAEFAYLPSEHLLGLSTPDRNWGEDWERYGFAAGAVALGGCECGAVGCHPLIVSIEVSDGTVRWHGFQSSEVGRIDLGPFLFNHRRYVAALRRPR